MKKLTLFLFIFCSLFILSCKKNNQTVINDLFIGAIKNGQNWVARPSVTLLPTKDSIQVTGYKAVGEESLNFKIPFHGVGTYAVKNSNAYYFTTIGTDAITSRYILDTTRVNTITVRSFNAYSGIASGTFQLSFSKEEGENEPANIAFTGGQFYFYVPD